MTVRWGRLDGQLGLIEDLVRPKNRVPGLLPRPVTDAPSTQPENTCGITCRSVRS